MGRIPRGDEGGVGKVKSGDPPNIWRFGACKFAFRMYLLSNSFVLPREVLYVSFRLIESTKNHIVWPEDGRNRKVCSGMKMD